MIFHSYVSLPEGNNLANTRDNRPYTSIPSIASPTKLRLWTPDSKIGWVDAHDLPLICSSQMLCTNMYPKNDLFRETNPTEQMMFHPIMLLLKAHNFCWAFGGSMDYYGRAICWMKEHTLDGRHRLTGHGRRTRRSSTGSMSGC